MADDPTMAGGAAGEPVATPEAVSSQPSDQPAVSDASAAPATPDPQQQFWETARNVDFSKAPDDIRAKVEAPFLSLSSKKIEEANQREQRLLALLERMATQNPNAQTPQVDPRAQLREKWEQGDIDGVADMIKRETYNEFAPQLDAVAQRNAIEVAAQIRPEIADKAIEAEVAAILQQNPLLVRYAAMNNREIAPFILAGATANALVPRLQAENKALKESIEQEKRKAVEDYQARLRGLPSSTSQAGKTPTALPSQKPMSLRESMEKALAEQVGA